jgi:hypothetical protein
MPSLRVTTRVTPKGESGGPASPGLNEAGRAATEAVLLGRTTSRSTFWRSATPSHPPREHADRFLAARLFTMRLGEIGVDLPRPDPLPVQCHDLLVQLLHPRLA